MAEYAAPFQSIAGTSVRTFTLQAARPTFPEQLEVYASIPTRIGTDDVNAEAGQRDPVRTLANVSWLTAQQKTDFIALLEAIYSGFVAAEDLEYGTWHEQL